MAEQFIHIKDVPPGDPPEDVCAAWVGLTLPVIRYIHEKDQVHVVGVVTNAVDLENSDGYMVDAKVAIALLRMVDRDAAAWWDENVPYLSNLVFSEKVCEVITWSHPIVR